MDENRKIVIFDGVCNLCNAGINFVIKRDPRRVFYFSPMQSEISRQLINKYRGPAFEFDTFLLIKDGFCYERTDAIMEILKDLSGYWYLFRILKLVPKTIRDSVYNFIAKSRYQIFGKRDKCMVPTQNVRERFLES